MSVVRKSKLSVIKLSVIMMSGFQNSLAYLYKIEFDLSETILSYQGKNRHIPLILTDSFAPLIKNLFFKEIDQQVW